uniref:sphingomyelin phosphodiesterase n=1 Tax=Glossina palpalis gambiensis TaxID=67801 RepID=A0A1B0B0D8_9MUSC
MWSMQLSIITFNVWGIPFISSDRSARIIDIAIQLNTGNYDIVSLQEVWSENDSRLLQNMTKKVLPYAHYFYSGVMGSGLLVLSKFPIVSSIFHGWTVNGYFHRIQHADWFGGKGVGLCRIRVANDRYVHVYNAHLHAEYNIKNDDYKTHRVLQAFDTAQFIDATRGDSMVQVLAGDFNAKPGDLSYGILLHISEMIDTCSSELIATYECKDNAYTSKAALAKNSTGQRIDHIFMRNSDDKVKASVMEYKLPLPPRVPGKRYSYSDHEAVQVKLKIEELQEADITRLIKNNHYECGRNVYYTTSNGFMAASEKKNTGHFYVVDTLLQMALINEGITVCERHLKQLYRDRIAYLCVALFLLIGFLFMSEFPVTYVYRTIFILLKLVTFGIVLYCLFMGTLWNLIERHGTMSGKTAMEIKLGGLQLAERESYAI